MVNINQATTEPPITYTMHLTKEQLMAAKDNPLTLKHPYDNQFEGWHVKASTKVAGKDSHDGHIRSKLRSRRLTKVNVKTTTLLAIKYGVELSCISKCIIMYVVMRTTKIPFL